MRKSSKWVFKLFLTVLGVFLLAGAAGLLSPAPALATGGDITISGPGLNNPGPITVTQYQLRGTVDLPPELQAVYGKALLDQYDEWYSTINTWPTKNWYRGQGVKLTDLLKLAGGLNENATLIRFTASDGFQTTFTVQEFVYTPRYRFPNFMDTGVFGHIPGDPSGAVPVEAIIAHRSYSTQNIEDILGEYADDNFSRNDANHLLYGQRAVTQQTNARFAKYVTAIEVLTDPVPKWDNPTANPAPGEVLAGTMVELHSPYDDEDKVHYTLDGSDPTINSPMYNWIAKRWWSSREDVLNEINHPIEITQNTTIKAFVTGPGREDSDIVIFEYQVPLTINTDNPANATENETYAGHTFTSAGGVEPYSFAVTAGVLPAGMVLNGAVLEGTPTESGTFVFTVTVTDSSEPAETDSHEFTLVVDEGLVPVTSVSIPEGDQELEEGETFQLTAVVEPENATNKDVSWSTSNETVATVSETGLVTAVSAGTATITVTTDDGGLTDSITVTVTAPNDNEAPTWPAGSELTAVVSGNSVALSWPAATDNIGVTNYKVYKDDTLVDTVTSATRSYTVDGLEPDTYTFGVKAVDAADNHSVALTANATVEPAGPVPLVINTDNPANATKNEAYAGHTFTAAGGSAPYNFAVTDGALPAGMALNGAVLEGTPTESGTFVFTVTVTDSAEPADTDSHVFTLVVDEGLAPVTSVSIPEGDQELEEGETFQLTAVVEPENATNKDVSWSTSNETVATVSETGLVTAVSAGTATITVTTDDGGLTDSITVTVVPDIPLTIVVKENGVETRTVEYDMNEWEPVQQQRYSARDSMPAYRLGAAEGVFLEDILDDADINVDNVSSFKFISTDGQSMTVSRSELLDVPRYYYPNVFSSNPEEGAVPVKPMLALKSYVGARGSSEPPPFEIMDYQNTIRLFVGQKNTSDINYSLFAKWVYEVEVEMLAAAPNLTPDTTDNTVGRAVDITYTDDAAWRAAITEVSVDGVALPADKYTISEGKITLHAGVFTEAKDFAIVVKAGGYQDATVTQTIMTETEPDTEAPAWASGSELTADVSGSSVTLSWPAATDNVEVTGYNVYQGETLLTATPITTTSYTVTGLAPGSYSFSVKAVDAAGNESAALTSDATIAPGTITISGVPATITLNIGGTQTLSVTTEPADVSVTYASSNEAVATVDASGVITAVGPGEAAITVTASKEGYTTATATCTVTVASAGAPVWAEGSKLTASIEGSNVTLSWPAATDSVGVTGYRVYQNGTLVDTVSGDTRSYTFTGLSAGNEYTFKVEADNAAGKWSTNGPSCAIKLPESTAEPVTVTDADYYVPKYNDTVSGNVYSNPLPQINLIANTSLSQTTPVQVEIPAGVTVTAPAAWDGIIHAPEVSSATISNATVSAAIEIGFSEGTLNFDKAVKLLIPGQAGKKVGYFSSDGTFYPINTVVEATNSEAVTAELAAKSAREGKQNAGNDLVIWTMHFTKFVTYTQRSSGSGGDGGGATTLQPVTSTTGSAIVTPSAGGTISLGSEATIKVPANALTGTSAVEVKVQKVTAPPAVPSGFQLAGSVYEFSVDGKNSYNFAKNVTITLSFDPGALSAGETPAIYYYDEAKGQWVNLGGTVSGNTITVQVDHFTKFAVLAVKKEEQKVETLKDINGHWAQANIDKLVALGCISGYPDGTFKPDNTITRAEFATMLVKAFELENKGGKIFADTAAHWAKDYIAAAAANGVVNGYDTYTFGPDDLITREQMAVMIVKAAKLATESSQGTSFLDNADISSWAAGAVAVAVRNGVIKGYPDNTFLPQGQATRAEAVTVIVNALK